MYCITIQHKEVYNHLMKLGNYKASMSNVSDILRKPYKFMMKEFNWESCPIFLAPVGHYVEFGGAKFDNDSIAIELEVPDEYIKIQRYYDWSDFVYFTDCPWEFENAFNVDKFPNIESWAKTILDIKDDIARADSLNDPLQATVIELKKEWIKDTTTNLSKLDDEHNGTGGMSLLERLEKYK